MESLVIRCQRKGVIPKPAAVPRAQQHGQFARGRVISLPRDRWLRARAETRSTQGRRFEVIGRARFQRKIDGTSFFQQFRGGDLLWSADGLRRATGEENRG